MLEKLGSQTKVLQYWNDLAPHLQARFCLSSSLGVKIKIERIGNLEYFPQYVGRASSRGMDIVRSHHKKVLGSADLVTYLVYDNQQWSDSGQGAGVAYTGTVCGPPYMDPQKMSINEYYERTAFMASVSFKIIYLN